MKNFITSIFLFTLVLGNVPVYSETRISEIEFAETTFSDVIRTLSEMSESNIIATPDAMEQTVTVHLKNVSLEEAIKSISRISGLWYRFDKDTNTFRIMTHEEYGRDLIVQESDNIEVFRLRNANVRIVAQAIEDLYGDRIELSLGIEAGESTSSSGSSSSSNRGSSSRNSNSSSSNSNRSSSNSQGSSDNTSQIGSFIASDDLSVDQIERLAAQQGSLTAETVQKVTLQAQPVYITVNNEHNMILVRTDDQKVINSIRSLINKMDLAIPQVMLEMKVLGITLGEDFNSIFNFELQPSGSNQSSQPILIGNNALLNSGSFVYEFLNNRLQANIEFLEENKRVKVLSNPMVLASNHREAELFIGEERLLTRGFTFNPAVIDSGVIVSPSFVETDTELQDIGITLRLTPRINSDKTVTIDLEQETSTVIVGGGSIPVSDGEGSVVNQPIDTVDTSRLDGVVVAKDGLTVAVGGLIRNSKSINQKKVPILGEIPVLGRLFRSDIETEEDTETVLLITPRILTTPEESEGIRKTDNPYYKSFNNNFPDPEEFPNKFIDKKDSEERVEVKQVPTPKNSQAATQKTDSRQQIYMDMSQFAADMVRVPEVERVKNDNYRPVWVERTPTDLFADRRIVATPEFSWNRGGLYVTAVSIANKSNEAVPVHYQAVPGRWLASSIEQPILGPNSQADGNTYLYLVSALPFNDVLSTN